MIQLTQRRTEITNISMTAEEAKTVAIQYIKAVVIGDGCYITNEGRLEHWTSCPHGSGTTTDKGKPTPLQLAAWEFLTLLRANEM
jgi:hypothetical protein